MLSGALHLLNMDLNSLVRLFVRGSHGLGLSLRRAALYLPSGGVRCLGNHVGAHRAYKECYPFLPIVVLPIGAVECLGGVGR